MGRNSTATRNIALTSYAQGIMQDRLAAYRLANLLCPIVPVGAAVGTFKIFDDRNDFLPVDMARPLGGPRARITHDATDGTYACKPQGIEVPVDDFELDLSGGQQDPVARQLLEQGKIRSMLGKKATGYAKQVTDFVFANLTPVSGRGDFSSANIDPIDQIDEQIKELSILASSTENIVVVLGVSVWEKIRRNAKVKARCGGVQLEAITLDQLNKSFMFPVKLEVSATSYMATKRGQSATSPGASKTEMMSSYVVIANSFPNPTVDDPSPFKCFSTSSVLVDAVNTYREESSASDIHFMDWSQDIKACGTALARLIAVT